MSWNGLKDLRPRGRLKQALMLAAVIGLGTAGLAWAGHQGLRAYGAGAGGHHGFREAFGKLHVQFVTEHVLREAEATPEQRERVEAILDRAFAEHGRFREQHQALRAEGLEIFTAETLDRERLEALRARHMQVAEQGSRHVTAVLADVAEVLTPAQRQKLAAHVRQMFE